MNKNNLKFFPCENIDNLALKVANEFITIINISKQPILGLATGSSPIKIYQNLIDLYHQKKVSFKNCVTFNLDEYVGLLPKYSSQSYVYFMNEKLFSKINIDDKNTHFPCKPFDINIKTDYQDYDQLIAKHNGIDLLLLGIGNNGHIGFNEPGSKLDSLTRLVNLTSSTIEANSRFFDSIKDVPKQAVTMGLATILKAKKIILIVIGKAKKEVFEKLKTAQIFNSKYPCTALVNHHDVSVYYLIDEMK